MWNNASVISAFSRRRHKNMSLNYGDTSDSLKHRETFLKRLGIDYRDLVCAKQTHGSNIRYIEDKDKASGALSYDTAILDTDALVTDKRNLPLAIFTADCLSIFLYDSEAPAAGLVHAGWRSTKENISAKTIQLMKERFNTKIEHLYLGFGPAIRKCCYKVGKEFSDYFPHGLKKRGGDYYLDLIETNKIQFLEAGVKEKNILDSDICTFCRHKEFFSYRRQGNACGRMISVIMLKERG